MMRGKSEPGPEPGIAIGPALRDGLNAAAGVSRAMASDWASDPAWRAQIAPVDAARSLAELVPAAHALLSTVGWLEAIVDRWMAVLRDAMLAEPPVRANRAPGRWTLVLHEGPSATITATVLPDGVVDAGANARVVQSGRWNLTHYLRAGGARLERWDCGQAPQGASGARPGGNCDATAARLGDIALADGHVVATDGRRIAQRLVQQTPRPVAMLSLSARLEAAPLVVERDAQSGRVTRNATSDEGAARTQMMLRLLRALDRSDAIHCFDAASRDIAPFLRWEAMREWLLLDAATALPRLTGLADGDPDAGVRAAASQTLDRIGAACLA